MDTLDSASLGWLFTTFLLAGLVKGVTGMGLPTVAMGLLGIWMPPVAAAALLLVPSFATNVRQSVGVHTWPLLGRLWPMLLCLFLGTLLGTLALTRVDAAWSAGALGGILIVYAAYGLLGPALAVPRRLETRLAPAVGLLTGLTTGLTGVFVMPAVPYLQALALDKDELVQALGCAFTVSTVALGAGLLLHDALRIEQLGLSLGAVLPALLGMSLGQKIRNRLSLRAFRRCFLVFLLLLGGELASRPFL